MGVEGKLPYSFTFLLQLPRVKTAFISVVSKSELSFSRLCFLISLSPFILI